MKYLFPSLVVSFLMIISCGPSHDNSSEKSEQSSGSSGRSASEITVTSDKEQYPVSSSAAVENNSDSNRKFIRTADLRFRVPDVVKTTYKIEDIARDNNGFVSYTNLSSELSFEDTKALSADTNLIITHFTITNSMTIRVPNILLDTTLKQIAPLIEFMDYRIIKATDVALDILSDRLAQERSKKHDSRLSKVADGNESKAKDIISAAESMMNSQERSDQALLSGLALKDQISYSTINLQLYQRPSVKYSLVANEKSINAYESGFWEKAGEALQTGLGVFLAFLLFLIKIWWLILLGVVAYIIYPIVSKKKKSSK